MQAISESALTFRPDPATSAQRAGIVPYKMDANGKVYWLMGRTHSGFLTDFGGGCKTRFHESPVDCALRELREELGYVSYDLIREIEFNLFNPRKTAIYQGQPARPGSEVRRYIFYVNISVPWDVVRDFRPTDEIASIQWVDPTSITQNTKINSSIVEWLVYWRRFLM